MKTLMIAVIAGAFAATAGAQTTAPAAAPATDARRSRRW